MVNRRGQWSDKPLERATWIQLGNKDTQDSDNKKRSRRFIDTPATRYQVKLRPHKGKSMRKLPSMN